MQKSATSCLASSASLVSTRHQRGRSILFHSIRRPLVCICKNDIWGRITRLGSIFATELLLLVHIFLCSFCLGVSSCYSTFCTTFSSCPRSFCSFPLEVESTMLYEHFSYLGSKFTSFNFHTVFIFLHRCRYQATLQQSRVQ